MVLLMTDMMMTKEKRMTQMMLELVSLVFTLTSSMVSAGAGPTVTTAGVGLILKRIFSFFLSLMEVVVLAGS